jgi:hypothetical protein
MLMPQGKLSGIVLVAAAVLFLTACPPRESIVRVTRDPGRFAGREITVAGHVTNSFGAMGSGAFEVDDGTGHLWVFSDHYGIPGRDARVAVTGRIEQGFSFRGRNFGTILRETHRRHES